MEETFHSEHDTCSEHVDPKFINSQFALEDELGATDHADALQENIAISSYVDEEPVYRSVAVEFAPSALPVNVGDACNEGENLYSDESAMQHLEEQRLATQARPYESQCRHGNCAILPEVPYMLMHTNFEVATTSIDRLQRQVTMCLADIEGASFEMSKSCYEWNGVIINGSTHCKFQIRVYGKTPPQQYIVEAHRLSGDASCFQSMFAILKGRICSLCANDSDPQQDVDLSAVSTLRQWLQCSHCDGYECSTSESHEALQCILNMMKGPCATSQLEACKILCNLTQDDSLTQAICDCGAVGLLGSFLSVECAKDSCEWTKQHACIAIANLSENPKGQEAIMSAGMLPALLRLSADGPYQSSELRRSAVFILANLSASSSSRVVNALERRELVSWMNSVEELCDERLKQHAVRAKEKLSKELTPLPIKS